MAKKEDELIELGIKEGLIKIRDNRIEYVVQKKTYDFTHPEEPIRARTYCDLVFNHKYPANRVDFEIYPPARLPPYPADIVIYKEDEKVHAYIVVEVKATSDESDITTAKKEGLGNGNLHLAQYLLLACGKFEATYNLEKRPSLKTLERYRIPAVPERYGKPPKYRFTKGGGVFFDLGKADLNDLMSKFQRCHDTIWEGGKRDPAVAFDEMSKLMFAKIFDERFTKVGDPYRFQIGSYEDSNIVGSRVRMIYKEVQNKEPEVFKKPIEVPDRIIFEAVKNLQDISLIETDLDAKGRAFESFLGNVFRGPFGQYFTPREIVEFMVEMIDPNEKDLVIDPACGSGGFLLYSIKLIREKIRRNYEGYPETIKRIDYDFSHYNVFGIEINDRIARVAMMDMVIHDDGHTNIECNDGLVNYGAYGPRREIRANKYDIVLTNPPFGGAQEDREEILKNFELGHFEDGSIREKQRKDFLFIERCLDLLKPNKKMGIVLPDGILNNITWQYARDFIKRKADVLAIVSLPEETFYPFGSYQKTSILFLRKKPSEDADTQPKEVFMAKVENVGYDATGKPTGVNDLKTTVLPRYNLFSDLYKKLPEPKIQRVELSKITEDFPVEEYEKGFTIEFKELEKEKRWDAEHFRPKVKTLIKTLKELNCPKIGKLVKPYRKKVKAPSAETKYEIVKYVEKIGSEDGKIFYAEKPYKDIPEGARYRFQANTILVSRINAKIRCISIIPEELNGIFGTSEYYGLIPREGVSIVYLHRILRSEIVRQQIVAATTGLFKRLSENKLKELLAPLPDPELQEKVTKAKIRAEELRREAEKIERETLETVISKIETPLRVSSSATTPNVEA